MRLTLQQLETHLRGAANILRGKTAGQNYENYILSLMFYKRLCDQWECEADDAIAELERQHGSWILDQLDRAERLRGVRRAMQGRVGEILFHGEPTQVHIKLTPSRVAGNAVRFIDGQIVVWRGLRSRTPVVRSLENWLRREARRTIENHLSAVTAHLGQRPQRVYVMGQRTKWGNCSRRRNLSFNWRLILAPDYVFRYLVTHEAVHLAIPDHSARFWLTVQSLCGNTEKAKQWLRRHYARLQIDLASVLEGIPANRRHATVRC